MTRPAVSGPVATEPVTDPDEEIFLLYTALQGAPASSNSETNFRGLGHVDSRADILTVRLELQPPLEIEEATCRSASSDVSAVSEVEEKGKRHRHGKRGKASSRRKSAAQPMGKIIEIELRQDKTALHSRKGDTGSVLWKASIDFGKAVLEQLHFGARLPLFMKDVLATSHVLELGAGTGLLALLFAPFVAHYTVTDIPQLVPLIQKNISASETNVSNVTASALDWLLLQSTPSSSRSCHFVYSPCPPDLLLVVDCIYHPSLLPALVETIDWISVPGETLVVVVVELRAEDVLRSFLSLWIQKGTWVISRVLDLLQLPYVVWIGYKLEDEDHPI
ncbi:hypothetical protein HGRIS_004043 [Hohenbuehelia grisea]|uniref:Uncharacterized protein n=1 Tax=Hohenbuehelia grisea TaxID=104357 RepID=A0ABR3JHA5_9AGAR